MKTTFWSLAAAAIVSLAQQSACVAEEDAVLSLATETAKQLTTSAAGEYWLGVSCVPPSADLREQLKLPEEQGLVAADIAADSPAARAGLKKHDVLLTAGGRKLTTAKDLAEAAQSTPEGELKLQIIRGGAPQELIVKPAKRLELNFDAGPLSVRMIRAGHLLPARAVLHVQRRPLPDDMTVTIQKHGNAPAKVTVTQGEKSWDATEDKLDELPADVRAHVDGMLNRVAIPLPAPAGDVLTYVAECTRDDVDEVKAHAKHVAQEAIVAAERSVKRKAVEARNKAEQVAREHAEVAIEKGRSWLSRQVDKQLDEKLADLDRRLEDVRNLVIELRGNRPTAQESSELPAPDADDSDEVKVEKAKDAKLSPPEKDQP